MSKILAFAGSTRRESFNRKLIRWAAQVAEDQGAEITLVELSDYPLPLYNGDLEQESGIPENADQLYQLMKDHQALLIASPEYNSSLSPLLKNTIDWVSRPRPGDPRLAAFTGKVAALLSASPGTLGGLRGLVHLRAILQNIGTMVIPAQAAVSQANDTFSTDGTFQDQQQAERVTKVVTDLISTTQKLCG